MEKNYMGVIKMMESIELRQEQPADYRETELLTREAFWNYYTPGCSEHYLLHIMRDSPSFIKELGFVAVLNGKIVGNIIYTKSFILADNENKYEVLTLGPLSVLPDFQRNGIARMLIENTRMLAAQMGFRAILLCGDPDFYSRVGYVPAEDFGIRTADNMYSKALHICGLYEGALDSIRGRYVEDEIFNVDADEVADFDKRFASKPIIVDTPTQKRFQEIVAMHRSAEPLDTEL